MNGGSGPQHNRQFGQVIIAVSVVIAISLLVISLPAISEAIDASQSPSINNQSNGSDAEYHWWIGEGSMGAGTTSQIGLEATAATNVTPFRNRSTSTAFTVVTAAPDYWRTGAYNTYQGRWIRTGDPIPYRGLIPANRPVTTRITQNVTLERKAVALPGAYQAANVSGVQTNELVVSSEAGVHAEGVVENNSTYSIASYRYRPSPRMLDDAGQEYPHSVEQRYTQLPEDLSPRVDELAAEMTEDTETPYASATLIEHSLERSKSYSLNTTHDPGSDPVEHFLFEMEGGDSTYFASSMVVLLRAEEIPARYVTGYTVGEPVEGQPKYIVRDVNAHAWVEVYFPGHGWIAFDPTPTKQRLAVENTAVGEPGAMAHVPRINENASALGLDIDRLITYSLEEIAKEKRESVTAEANTSAEDTTNETVPDGDNTTSETTGSQADGDPNTGGTDGTNQDSPDEPTQPPGLNAQLSTAEPEPGEKVTVTVKRDGNAVQGATVWFNSQRIGVTDSSGTVSGTVPYAKSLTVVASTNSTAVGSPSAVPGNVGTWNPHKQDFRSAIAPAESNADHRESEERAFQSTESSRESTAQPPTDAASSDYGSAQRAVATTGTASVDETVVTVPISATVSMDVSPEPAVTNGTAIVQLLVNGNPVPHAKVTVDESDVGRTDATGQYVLDIGDPEGNTRSITVQRGELGAHRQISVGTLTVTSQNDNAWLFPGQNLTLVVKAGQTPLSDVPVTSSGDVIGKTNAAGMTKVSLPVAQRTEYEVTYGGQSRVYAATGMLRNMGIVGIVSIGWVGVVLGGMRRLRRGGEGISRFEQRVNSVFGRLFDRLLNASTWLANRLVSLQDSTEGVLTRAIQWATTFELRSAGALLQRPGAFLVALVSALGTVISIIVGNLPFRGSGGDQERSEQEFSVDAEKSRNIVSIRRAWWRLVHLVFRKVEPTNTPTELAQQAIDAGLPRGPVVRLLDMFRAVEYGRVDADEHVENANAAISEIEGHAEASESGLGNETDSSIESREER